MKLLHDIHHSLAKMKNQIVPSLRLRDEIWTIQIWAGESPFRLSPLQTIKNPVMCAEQVTDVAAAFVADPFLTYEEGRWFMFFETLEQHSNRGVICLAQSTDGHCWTYGGIVLREDFHLSYPYTFKVDDAYYMIPESAGAGAVRLYRSTDFPTQWSFVGNLVEGIHRDPSIFQFAGRWWLFSESSPRGDGTLRLHTASELTGPWTEHPRSPIIDGNPHVTRPGGRVLEHDGRLFRIAQDTYPEYGIQLFAFEILELTTTSYLERLVGNGPVLKGKGRGLSRERIHHMDAHKISETQWIAAIDHSRRTWAPKIGKFAPFA
jgi:hypothetical protein